MRLAEKVALITGASGGIGRQASVLFAREGAKIVAVDVNDDGGAETVSLVEETGGEAVFVHADVSQSVACERMIMTAEEKYGALHILFNNAGIMDARDDDAVNTKEEIWDRTMAINLKGVFFGCKYGIPALRRAGGGSIINTASFVALMGAATPQIAYTASKGGVLAMSRELAIVHAKENIRVNSLCPGPLKTKLLMDYLDTDEKKQRRLVHIPMGRFGLAEEMAQAALFLASDEASYMTGAELVVDGGLSNAYVTPE